MRPYTSTTPGTLPRATFLAAALLVALGACEGEEPDAYGNFEATEIVVSAEVGGKLLEFEPDEGDRVAAGAIVGAIDTTTLTLQRAELEAQRAAVRTRTVEGEAQLGALQAQLATAQEEHDRAQRLFRVEAATAQQLERAQGDVRVLRERIEGARAQVAAVRQESRVIGARIEQVEEQLRRTRIVNPRQGIVLATYVERGELVQPGQPLYRVADLDTLTLRAYVSGAQLAQVRIGERVHVQVDVGRDDLTSLDGYVSWIASSAEFTPTPIQTREERTDQVYAVRVRVANPDGLLKIGMPGELVLGAAADASRTVDVGTDAPKPSVP